MKQLRLSNYLNKLIASFKDHGSLKLVNFPDDLLFYLHSYLKKPLLIILPDDSVEERIKNIEPLLNNEDVVFIPPPIDATKFPPGFQPQFQQYLNNAKNKLKSGIKDVNLIFTAASGLKIPLVGDGLLANYIVESSSDYDSLIGFLMKNDYHVVDFISMPGDVAKRGGIIDVYPKDNEKPYRINFFDSNPAINEMDVDTQLTIKTIDSLAIASSNKSIVDPLEKFLGLHFLKMEIDVFGNKFLGEKPFYEFIFPLEKISFRQFSQQKITSFNSIQSCRELITVGLLDLHKNLLVPGWFTNKPVVKYFQSSTKRIPSLEMTNLQKGDFLVHRDHGVGKYAGLRSFEDKAGNLQEFISLKYADGGIVSVDLSKMDLLWYYGSSDETVILDSLSSQGKWVRKKNCAQKRAEEVVEQLLNLYAYRSDSPRPPFIADGFLEEEFLNKFPFEETVDQETAWNEISADLSSSTSMDRLLCGDVGFGKTELAIRSAFRVVNANMRVLVLAPTTILANQLFGAFNSRLNPFAISVEMVSRFRKKTEIDKVKQNIELGRNDVLIGTHALLNDHIYLKNIGLLIVDEEHRFGVKQKEKVKHYKKNVDVLSMSATPIPRSLNLSLAGLYQISMLQTAPRFRLPIKTQVAFFDKRIIKSAVNFEINRGGQVYLVHNDINSIENISKTLAGYFPNLNIDFLHGQEAPSIIERKMGLFLSGAIDLLVCTSIIETGIDIPNVNCIIINRAHLFGLAQLYQMRGRVGRSHRQAYAYLLIPHGMKLSTKAFSRIKAVEENIRLGSGYNISKSDMELRGAGALFGYSQSGGIADIGYEMYLSLVRSVLNDTDKLKEGFLVLPENIEVQLYDKSFIPECYVGPPNLRVSFYKNLSKAYRKEELDYIKHHLENRFGPMPQVVDNLIREFVLRLEAAQGGVKFIKKQGCGIIVNILPLDKKIPDNNRFVKYIETFFNKKGIDFHFTPTKEESLGLCFHVANEEDNYSILSRFLNKLSSLHQTNYLR